MIIDRLLNNKRRSVIVFCNGWGMDSNPFSSMESEFHDVIVLYNFVNFSKKGELLQLLDNYSELILIGWSMGVWAGQILFGDTEKSFSRTLAINGTLCPVDDMYGISRELFTATMEGWSEITRKKFYRRMCGTKDITKLFSEKQPTRGLTDQQNELQYYLRSATCIDCNESIYNEVVVSDKDRIVPSDNQLEYWQKGNISRIRGSHFIFYNWQTWDELLDSISDQSLI